MAGANDGKQIQDLPPPWFGVDHGIDKLEEAVRLDEVQAIRVKWQPLSEVTWNANVHFQTRGGIELEMNLSESGYAALLKRVKEVSTLNDERQGGQRLRRSRKALAAD